jgi:hypothetical protein
MTRLNAIMAREYEINGEKKTSFKNIGVAFPLKKGNGYQVILEAIPAPQDGQYKILLMEPRQEGQPQDHAPRDAYGQDSFADDAIPF